MKNFLLGLRELRLLTLEVRRFISDVFLLLTKMINDHIIPASLWNSGFSFLGVKGPSCSKDD